MTEVTFFEDFYCFEYHTQRDNTQRFRYWLYSPVYELPPPVGHCGTTMLDFQRERAVYSSDFLPSRLFRQSGS